MEGCVEIKMPQNSTRFGVTNCYKQRLNAETRFLFDVLDIFVAKTISSMKIRYIGENKESTK